MTAPAPPPGSFEAVAVPHLETLYRVGLRYTRDPSRAEDLVQDTMLRAFRAWSSFTPGTNIRGWLLTILRNTFINDYRRRQREPVATELEQIEPKALYHELGETDPEGQFFANLVDETVIQALDALPLEFREVIALSDIEGLSYHEIAEVLKIPVGTVKSRLFRARRLLQGALYDYAVEMGYIQSRSAE